MFELGSELRRQRDKISKRKKKNSKFIRYANLCAFIGMFLFVALLLLTNEPYGLTKGIYPLMSFIPYLLGLLFAIIVAMKGRPYRPSIEELLFLDVCSSLDDLILYIEDKREPDRKRAEKKIDKVSKKIEEWDIGNLKLCKKIIGSHFEPFKESFYRKVVGAVKKGEKEDLIKAYRILKTFAKFLVESEPKLEDLDSMKNAIDEGIGVTIPSRIPPRKKIFRSLKEATPLRHVITVTIFVLIGYVIGHVGYYNVGVTIEYAYLMAVTIPLTLVAAYLNYLRK